MIVLFKSYDKIAYEINKTTFLSQSDFVCKNVNKFHKL